MCTHVYGRFPKFHRVLLGRYPGTLKSDIVSTKTSTINLFGFETLKLKIRRLKLWRPTVCTSVALDQQLCPRVEAVSGSLSHNNNKINNNHNNDNNDTIANNNNAIITTMITIIVIMTMILLLLIIIIIKQIMIIMMIILITNGNEVCPQAPSTGSGLQTHPGLPLCK